jgi:hypothetical protein
MKRKQLKAVGAFQPLIKEISLFCDIEYCGLSQWGRVRMRSNSEQQARMCAISDQKTSFIKTSYGNFFPLFAESNLVICFAPWSSNAAAVQRKMRSCRRNRFTV